MRAAIKDASNLQARLANKRVPNLALQLALRPHMLLVMDGSVSEARYCFVTPGLVGIKSNSCAGVSIGVVLVQPRDGHGRISRHRR